MICNYDRTRKFGQIAKVNLMDSENNPSVVIPCYNVGAYLDQAVQSVLDQTFQDFEIIIIDDGWSDPLTRHLFIS